MIRRQLNVTEEEIRLNRKLDLLRQLHLREYSLLNERTNMFLLFNLVLMIGFTFRRDIISFKYLPMIGIFVSMIWIYIGYRTNLVKNYFGDEIIKYEAKLTDKEDRVFSEAFSWRNSKRKSSFYWEASTYTGRVFPVLWSIIWMIAFL
jgi:hypothetical protein